MANIHNVTIFGAQTIFIFFLFPFVLYFSKLSVFVNCHSTWDALQVIMKEVNSQLEIHLFTLISWDVLFEWFFSLTPFVFVIRSLHWIMIKNSIQNRFDCSTMINFESFFFLLNLQMNSPIKYVNIYFECKNVWFMQTLAHNQKMAQSNGMWQ